MYNINSEFIIYLIKINMNFKDISISKKNELNKTISNNKLQNLKSDYFFEKKNIQKYFHQ